MNLILVLDDSLCFEEFHSCQISQKKNEANKWKKSNEKYDSEKNNIEKKNMKKKYRKIYQSRENFNIRRFTWLKYRDKRKRNFDKKNEKIYCDMNWWQLNNFVSGISRRLYEYHFVNQVFLYQIQCFFRWHEIVLRQCDHSMNNSKSNWQS